MSTSPSTEAHLDLSLPEEWQRVVADASALVGQGINEFAAAVLLRESRQILADAQANRLSTRDRDAFLAALEDEDLEPNAALTAAAERQRGRLAE